MSQDRRRIIRCIVFLALIFTRSLNAQELLSEVLKKGYISQWMILGPVPSDLQGGIENAVANNRLPLNERSVFGDIETLLPQSATPLRIGNQTYSWRVITANSAFLDLSSLVSGMESVFVLASYVQVPEDQIVFIHLQTPIGARLWISKTQVITLKNKPLEQVGSDRALVRIRKGLNLFVIEIPFLSIDRISEISRISKTDIPFVLWPNKEAPIGNTGFELGFHILPTREVGSIFYVPQMQATRHFVGSALNPQQVFLLTVYNPNARMINPIQIQALYIPPDRLAGQKTISLMPEEEAQVPIPVSVRGIDMSRPVRVKVIITAPDLEGKPVRSEFEDELTLNTLEPISKTYIVTGGLLERTGDKTVAEQMKAISRHCKSQVLYALTQQDYGINIGSGSTWLRLLCDSPELILSVRDLISRGKTSAESVFTSIDERVVSTETIIRNYFIGLKLKEIFLKNFTPSLCLWDYPYLTPQTAQWCEQMGIKGILINSLADELPEFFRWVAPSSHNTLVRRGKSMSEITSVAQLKKWAYMYHQPLQSFIPALDVIVYEQRKPIPEPVLTEALDQQIPPFYVRGTGVAEFFEEVSSYLEKDTYARNVSLYTKSLIFTTPLNEIYHHSSLKTCLSVFDAKLQLAEILSTLAGTQGLAYPAELMARLWMALLFFAHPSILNGRLNEEEYMSAFCHISWGIHDCDRIIRSAISHLADQTHTLTHMGNQRGSPVPIVVFNPNLIEKTYPVTIDLQMGTLPTGNLLTPDEKPVPYLLFETKRVGDRSTGHALEFVAEAVPPLGTRVYYWLPDESKPVMVETTDTFIENEFLRLKINDEGEIAHLFDKKSGKVIFGGVPGSEMDSLYVCSLDFSSVEKVVGQRKDITTLKSETAEKLRITLESSIGRWVKEYRLYRGISKVFCIHRFYPQPSLTDVVIASGFRLTAKDKTIVLGSHAFAHTDVVRNVCINVSDQNQVANLAHRFFAVSDGYRLQFEDDRSLPVRTVGIIKPANDEMVELVHQLQKELWRLGIPVSVVDFEQFSTVDTQSNRDLYIWLGFDKDLQPLFERLSGQYPTSLAEEVQRRSGLGTPFLLGLSRDNVKLPLLGLVFPTREKGNSLISRFIEGMQYPERFLIPMLVTNVEGKQKDSNYSIAVFFQGSKLTLFDDGNCYLLHTGVSAEDLCRLSPMVMSYEIVPFVGHWLSSPVMYEAYAMPLVGVTTGLHGGRLKDGKGMLKVNGNLLPVLMSTKPLGFSSTLVQKDTFPSDGFVLRLFNPTPTMMMTRIESGYGIQRIVPMTIRESSIAGTSSIDTSGIVFQPWEIRTFEVSLKDVSAPNRFTVDESQFMYSRENRLYPFSSLYPNPVQLRLQPIISQGKTLVELTIANFSSYEFIEGKVNIESPLYTREITYQLTPMSSVQHHISLGENMKSDQGMFVSAWTEYKGKIYREFMNSTQSKPEIQFSKDNERITITIDNRNPSPVYGEIRWACMYYNEYGEEYSADMLVSPSQTDVYISTFDTKEYNFISAEPQGDIPIVAMLRLNSETVFIPDQ